MFSLATFIISLVLLILLFVMKSLELSRGRKIFLERQFENFDAWIHRSLLQIKFWWSHITFKNTKLVITFIALKIRKFAVMVKQRFDHKQSYFFTKKENPIHKSKGSVSFFLKNVSDYKKSLRDGNGTKN